MSADLDLHACCALIMAECPDPYAKSYAAAWIKGEVYDRARSTGTPLSNAMRVQISYILSNLDDWQGPNAKRVQASLRRLYQEAGRA